MTPRAGVTPPARGTRSLSPSPSSPCPLLPTLAWSLRAQRVLCAASCFLCTFPFCKHHLCAFLFFLQASLPGAFWGHGLCGLSGAHSAPSAGTLQDAAPSVPCPAQISLVIAFHANKKRVKEEASESFSTLAPVGRNVWHKRRFRGHGETPPPKFTHWLPTQSTIPVPPACRDRWWHRAPVHP